MPDGVPPRRGGKGDGPDASRMPVLEHLRELRRRLVASLVAVAVGILVAFGLSGWIWDFLVAPMSSALKAHGHGTMAVTSPLEGVVTFLSLSVIAGLVLAAPVVFHQAWAFVAPGLWPEERRPVVGMAVASSVLFLAGAAFGYFVIFRYAFPFFLAVVEGEAEPVISMRAYLSTAARLLIAFGLCFQLPVVVWFLARLGLVTARSMLRGYKYAVVAIFVVSAIITPPDILTQVLMALPLMLLYGVGIGVAAVVGPRRPAGSA